MLQALFPQIEDAMHRGHFVAGFFAYECGGFFEPSSAMRPRSATTNFSPGFGIYESCYRFDHATGKFLDGEPNVIFTPGLRFRLPPPPALSFALDEQQFTSRIEQIHEWIRAGDVYQLNFTFPVHIETRLRPAALYTSSSRRATR